LLERLLAVGQGGARVRPLGGSRAGEVRLGRFLHNPRVTPAEMVVTASLRTATLVGGRHVLAIQDTTSLRDDGDQCSLHLHPTIAVDAADGALLGLVHAEFLARAGGQRASSGKRLFNDKESRRWLNATDEAGKLAIAGATCVTVIADREGDIYEEFACRRPTVEVLIRAHHDRILADGTRLYAQAESLPELGRDTIDLPAGPGRKARAAVLAVRACPVRIKRPKRNTAAEAAELPPEVTLWFVEAREIDPPADTTPAHWRLLTTHAVTSLADAVQITRFYRQRWTIEQVFRVMKTKGFNVEAVRIIEDAPFKNLAAAILIAAIQVLQMVRERDGAAGRPLADVFDAASQPALEAICATLEGKTDRQKNPHPKTSLAYAAWVCARLGGWTGYYDKPGPVVTLQGFMRCKAMLQGWQLAALV
jgi:Transposase DDE domain